MPVKNIKRRTNDGLQGTIVGLTDEEKQALIKDGELITKAYADKSYVQIGKDNEFSTGGILFGLHAKFITEEICGGISEGSDIVTINPSGKAGSGTISFVSAGNRVLSNGSTIFTGTYYNTADIYGGGNLSALNPAWKSIYGMVSAFQSQWNLVQGGFEALGFANSKTANERETAPNPSRLTFFSPIGTVSYYDLAGNAQYDYQLPKKSGTIALTSDLSEAGTSVTIRRW